MKYEPHIANFGTKNRSGVISTLPDWMLVDIECTMMSQKRSRIAMKKDSKNPYITE